MAAGEGTIGGIKTVAVKDWDQQPGEPLSWFSRFINYYVPLGTNRSLEQAFRDWQSKEALRSKGKRPNPTWYRVFKEWRWKERAHAWDMAQTSKAISETENEIVEMRKRQIRAAILFQNKALKRLDQLDAGELTPAEALRYLAQGIEIERQARGLPTKIIELMQLTDDELIEQYEQIFGILANPGSDRNSDALEGDTDPPASGDDES